MLATTHRKAPANPTYPQQRATKLHVPPDAVTSLSSFPVTPTHSQNREALSISKSTDILTHIYSLPHLTQEKAMSTIRAIEREAMATQVPQPDLKVLMDYLESRGVRKGICTRNFEYVFILNSSQWLEIAQLTSVSLIQRTCHSSPHKKSPYTRLCPYNYSCFLPSQA